MQEENVWHNEVITETVRQTLHDLRQTRVLEHFYLAGGTGLALQIGHRRSHDLDFFSLELFDEEALLQSLQRIGELSLVAKSPHTLHLVLQGTKASFFGYDYPLLFPLREFSGVEIADPRDITCMKLSAIASRGTKRDFVDLYASAQQFGLQALLQLLQQKFGRVHFSVPHLLKSLTYFDDAEKDPMPDMLTPLAWEDIKQFFVREAPRLL